MPPENAPAAAIPAAETDAADGLNPKDCQNCPRESDFVLSPAYLQEAPPRESDVEVDMQTYVNLRDITSAKVLAVTVQPLNNGYEEEIRRGKGFKKAYWNDHAVLHPVRLSDEKRKEGAQERKKQVAAYLAKKVVEHLKITDFLRMDWIRNGLWSFSVDLQEEETRNIGGFEDYVGTNCGLKAREGEANLACAYGHDLDNALPVTQDANYLPRMHWLKSALIIARDALQKALNSQLVFSGSADLKVSIAELKFEPHENGALSVSGRLKLVRPSDAKGEPEITDVQWRYDADAAERKETASACIAEVILRHLRSDPAFLDAANRGESFRRGNVWSHTIKIPTAEFAKVEGFEELAKMCADFGPLSAGLVSRVAGWFQNPDGNTAARKKPKIAQLLETLPGISQVFDEKLFGQLQSAKSEIDWSKKDLGSGEGWQRKLRADFSAAPGGNEIEIELSISVSDDRGMLNTIGAEAIGEISWKPEAQGNVGNSL